MDIVSAISVNEDYLIEVLGSIPSPTFTLFIFICILTVTGLYTFKTRGLLGPK